jgi:hypothetical protein
MSRGTQAEINKQDEQLEILSVEESHQESIKDIHADLNSKSRWLSLSNSSSFRNVDNAAKNIALAYMQPMSVLQVENTMEKYNMLIEACNAYLNSHRLPRLSPTGKHRHRKIKQMLASAQAERDLLDNNSGNKDFHHLSLEQFLVTTAQLKAVSAGFTAKTDGEPALNIINFSDFAEKVLDKKNIDKSLENAKNVEHIAMLLKSYHFFRDENSEAGVKNSLMSMIVLCSTNKMPKNKENRSPSQQALYDLFRQCLEQYHLISTEGFKEIEEQIVIEEKPVTVERKTGQINVEVPVKNIKTKNKIRPQFDIDEDFNIIEQEAPLKEDEVRVKKYYTEKQLRSHVREKNRKEAQERKQKQEAEAKRLAERTEPLWFTSITSNNRVAYQRIKFELSAIFEKYENIKPNFTAFAKAATAAYNYSSIDIDSLNRNKNTRKSMIEADFIMLEDALKKLKSVEDDFPHALDDKHDESAAMMREIVTFFKKYNGGTLDSPKIKN